MPREKVRWRTSAVIAERAKQMRRPLTPTERLFWARVRNEQLDGLHIRRQEAINRFIADFCHAPSKTVIEVDGDVHAEPSQMAHDRERDAWFAQNGYLVIRFTNDDVRHRLDGVLAEVARVCAERLAARRKTW